MQMLINIEQSLKLNPPKYPEYMTFKRRRFIKLKDLVTMTDQGVSLQPREKDLELAETNDIADSFRTNGVMYDKDPMVVSESVRGELELDAGHNRYNALLNDLGVDTYFADEVEYDSPYWRHVFKRSSNLGKDHIGKGTPTKEGDYQKALIEMKNDNCFNWKDDDAVREALFAMSNDTMKVSKIETQLKRFRLVEGSVAIGILPLNAGMANAKCKQLKLPYGGYMSNRKNAAFGRIGYVKGFGNFESKVVRWIKESIAHDKPVEIIGFLDNLNGPSNILQQRADWLKAFNKELNWIENEMPRHKNRIQFKGFIAQITSADPDNGGKPMETGIVNKLGNSIEL